MDIKDRVQPIRNGLLEMMVLKVISRHDVYAADILRALAETEFRTQEGTLYPLLSKLRRDELLDYEWRESESGPPRKYYRLTKNGQRYLKDLDAYWSLINKTIKTIGSSKSSNL